MKLASTAMAIERLSESSDWNVFLDWIQERMNAVARQAMLSDLTEFEYAELKDSYKTLLSVLQVKETTHEEASLAKEI